MSDVLSGWVTTVSLNAGEVAIVAARRGEAWLRFADPLRPPIALIRVWVDLFATALRAHRGDPKVSFPGAPASAGFVVDRDCVEPLIAAFYEALAFAEGKS